jgi:hypothetical protein
MSDPKQNRDPSSLGDDAPPESPEKKDPSMSPDRDSRPTLQQRIADLAPHLRIVKPNEARAKDPRTRDPSDAFAAAVAMAMRQQQEAELLNASSVLQRRSAMPAAAGFAIAGAALAALGYVALFPPTQSNSEQHTLTLRRPSAPPALVVHNHSAMLNEPLELGVSVEPAEPGATVTVKGLPIGAMLTTGEQMSLSEWQVAAEDTANTVVIPPRDFTGDINLSAELRNASGVPLVTTVMHLAWKAPPPVAAAITPAPQPVPRVAAATASSASAASPSIPPAPRVDPVRDLSASEVGSLIRLAQEMLAMADVKGARALLLRAADARDPRAAYALAKTYDPILSRQSGAPDAGPDLAQARSWYQKAREWGAPEAQRQLEALATTYGR